jgi:hypothetical protein
MSIDENSKEPMVKKTVDACPDQGGLRIRTTFSRI